MLEGPEEKLSEPEQWIKACLWAVRKLRFHLAFTPCTIILPDKALVNCFKVRECHPKFRGWLIKLAMYRVTLGAGEHGWIYSRSVCAGSSL